VAVKREDIQLHVDDVAAAADALARARSITLSQADHDRLAETLASLDDLEAIAVPAR
jgi:hypothetical protein